MIKFGWVAGTKDFELVTWKRASADLRLFNSSKRGWFWLCESMNQVSGHCRQICRHRCLSLVCQQPLLSTNNYELWPRATRAFLSARKMNMNTYLLRYSLPDSLILLMIHQWFNWALNPSLYKFSHQLENTRTEQARNLEDPMTMGRNHRPGSAQNPFRPLLACKALSTWGNVAYYIGPPALANFLRNLTREWVSTFHVNVIYLLLGRELKLLGPLDVTY